MFCPKCGGEAPDGQRFCKACGTNLQLINDAIRPGTQQGPFGIDVETLTRNAKEFAESWKKGWSGHGGQRVIGLKIPQSRTESLRAARQLRRQAREEARRRNLPKPKEYMSYSWQHNLRSGLMSLFWGTGLGVFLYYISRTAIDEGLIKAIEESSNGHVQGLEPLARMIWLIALLPILKGLSRIIYAAFFAESMATLTERFTPPPALPEPSPALRQNTAPVASQETAPRDFEPFSEPRPSVTEHTTHIFEEPQEKAKSETH
ncbi:MAG TPA: zinc ribbon domain-containing protein [Blastocatellia bacterium]|nr:zinc ribbon domain-containing protein [Blastocatellia bacterium]